MSTESRWRDRLAIRKQLLDHAQRGLEWARKNHRHPRGWRVALIKLRQAQVDQAQRVVDRHKNDGAPNALAYAARYVGTKENGKEPNRGVQVDKWEREVNMLGQPWCGAFMFACLEAGGVEHLSDRLRYCPYIIDDGKAGVNGLEKIVTFDDAKPGDLVVYQWDTGPVDHVGMLVGFAKDGTLNTIEGNTAIGNDSNGGEVMKRTRPRSVVAAIVRPRYPA